MGATRRSGQLGFLPCSLATTETAATRVEGLEEEEDALSGENCQTVHCSIIVIIKLSSGPEKCSAERLLG